MNQKQDKDLYAIIGVEHDVLQESIREAYLLRARVVHPDRFDQQKQPKEWKKANEMLAELNEAYAILGTPESRKRYDDLRERNQARNSEQPASRQEATTEPPIPPEFLAVTAGIARYADLPELTRRRLLERQNRRLEEQFQIQTNRIFKNFVYCAAFLMGFIFLFLGAARYEWNRPVIFLLGALSLFVGLLVGRNMVGITQWKRATLKSFFYLTPLYFIQTDHDNVSFYPIWSLKGIDVIHHIKKKTYRHTQIIFKFDNFHESVNVSPKKQVENLLALLKSYHARFQSELALGNGDYFRRYDDFNNVPRSNVSTNAVLPTKTTLTIYLLSVAICAALFILAVGMNKIYAQKRLYSEVVKTSSPPASELDKAVPLTRSERPLPESGETRLVAPLNPVAPLQIKAAFGTHYLVKLVDLKTRQLILTVFIRGGDSIEIKVPLGLYALRYASGSTWYGYDELFGTDTSYYQLEQPFDFTENNNQISGYVVVLYEHFQGNMKAAPIESKAF